MTAYLKSAQSFGEVMKAMAAKKFWVKATRGFVMAGKVVQPGEVVEVDHIFGSGLIGAKQAERCAAPEPAQPAASAPAVLAPAAPGEKTGESETSTTTAKATDKPKASR